MKTIPHDKFATLCYLILMQTGGGIEDKSPDYITEKMVILTSGYDAFSFLDYNNMAKCVRWLNQWGITLPLPIEKEWKLQCDAMAQFYEKGIKID